MKDDDRRGMANDGYTPSLKAPSPSPGGMKGYTPAISGKPKGPPKRVIDRSSSVPPSKKGD